MSTGWLFGATALRHAAKQGGLAILILSLAAPQPLLAQPAGGQVAAGQAVISQGAGQTDITQQSGRAIIDWHHFDIGYGERVNFAQPSAASVILNRVTGSRNPSQIMGQLNANGTVMLINPHGMVFGPGAQVNVGSLVASASNIDNHRFMAGDYTFNQAGSPGAEIVNQGTITAAQAGLVTLVAPSVRNSGVITARWGKVHLAGRDLFTLDLAGDGLIALQASPAMQNLLALNSGTINADGGQVVLSAGAAAAEVSSLIDNSGVITAQGGSILLSAAHSGSAGTVTNSGTLDVSHAGAVGGSIGLYGDRVGIWSGSRLDASGGIGGGSIRAGGDFYGIGGPLNAQDTIVQNGAILNARATQSGNGGSVVVWSDRNTLFAGEIDARGGATGGNGGRVETSGGNLSVAGNVDASAAHGNAGTWLLDPNDIIIQSGTDTNVTGNPSFTTLANSAIVSTQSINAALNAGTSVTVATGTGGANSQNGNITVNNSIAKTAGGDAGLTLKAHNNISFASGVGISSTSGRLNLTLNADIDGAGGGAILLNNNSINTNSGNIVMGGGANPLTGYAQANATAYGLAIAGGSNVNAAGGNITLRGRGRSGGCCNENGIVINGSSVVQTSGAGSITLDGISGSGTNYNHGVSMTGGGKVRTQNGDIILNAVTSNLNEFNSQALEFSGGAVIEATGSGNITVNALSPGIVGEIYTDNNAGNRIGNASMTGNIALNFDNVEITNLTIVSQGTVSFTPHTAGTTIGIAGGAGTLQLTNAILNNVSAGHIAFGNVHTGNIALGGRSWASNLSFSSRGLLTATGASNLGGKSFMSSTASGALGAITNASSISAIATDRLSINGMLSASGSGNSIVLSAGGLLDNQAGASALNPGAGNYVLYASSPGLLNEAGIGRQFTQYGQTHATLPPSAVNRGNGVVFASAAPSAPLAPVPAPVPPAPSLTETIGDQNARTINQLNRQPLVTAQNVSATLEAPAYAPASDRVVTTSTGGSTNLRSGRRTGGELCLERHCVGLATPASSNVYFTRH